MIKSYTRNKSMNSMNHIRNQISCFDALSAYVRALLGLATHVSSSNLWLLAIRETIYTTSAAVDTHLKT